LRSAPRTPTTTPSKAAKDKAAPPPQAEVTEVDWERRKEQRQRQIDIGKMTVGYIRYKEQHPNPAMSDPHTPKADSRKDRRDWNMDLKMWRTFLHKFDPPVDEETSTATDPSKVYAPADAPAALSDAPADAPADAPVEPCA
jgi:hypothetical protein